MGNNYELYEVFRCANRMRPYEIMNGLVVIASEVVFSPVDEIRSASRYYRSTMARHMMMNWLMKYCKYSQTKAADLVGQFCKYAPYDHTMAGYSARRFKHPIVDSFERQCWHDFEKKAISFITAPEEINYQI